MAIDPDAIKALLARTDLCALVSQDTPVKKAGKEWKCLCPFHDDSNPSFAIYEKDGMQLCRCMSCGWPTNVGAADAIRYVMDRRGLTFPDAFEYLGGQPELKRNISAEPKPRDREWISSKPPAGEPPPKSFAHYKHGEPSRTWTYLDADRSILGYVCRYDFGSNGSRGKTYQPFTWGHFEGDDEELWAAKSWTRGERPLYGLDRLAARSNTQVILHEGEKAADRGAELFKDQVSMSWPGGTGGWKHANFEPLRGAKVLLVPDAHRPGVECMQAIGRRLSDPNGLACRVRWCDTADMPDKWDVADMPPDTTPEQALAWAAGRITDFKAPEAVQVPEQATAGAVLPPVETPERAEGAAPTSQPDEPPPAEFPSEASAERPETDPEIAKLPVEMSEDALADAFAAQHGGNWRYVKVWHAWFEYECHSWQEDRLGKIDRLAVELCRAATYWPQASQLTALARRAISTRRMAGPVRDTAANDARIRAGVDQWDRRSMILGTPGGVVDLSTGVLGPGEREHYLTKRTSVTPAPGTPTLWLAHLRRMTGNDEDKVAFLQLYAGYCATGETREQCFAFLFGPGQNGKGVFVTTLARVLGDYAVFANSSTFMDSDGAERHLSELARLQGARLVVVDETDSSKRWNEARIKSITGGGKITANRMRQDPFDFEPQFKLLIAGNHRPQIRGVGKAIRRRIKLVECLTEIPETERDNYFDEKLRAEDAQILNWVIEGARMWRQSGLTAPESIEEATERYIQSEDTIGEWLEDCCRQSGEMETGAGYKSYCAWVESRNERAWSRRAWNNAMSEKGYDIRKSNGRRYLIGVSMREEQSSSSEPPSWHNQD